MLEAIAKNVWAQNGDLKMVGSARMPCRATIVRLPSGGLAIHSPLRIDDRTAREIDALGEVRALIAPNCYHWMFLAKAKERYPQARVFGAPGLEKKLGSFAFERLPKKGSVDGLEGLAVERIGGAETMQEHVFLHEASRSLVVSDLVFNVHASDSFLMRTVLRLGGAWKKTAQSRFWRFLVKDRARAAASARAILSWDFERVVVGHGDVIEDDARQRMREALAWMTGATPPILHAGSNAA